MNKNMQNMHKNPATDGKIDDKRKLTPKERNKIIIRLGGYVIRQWHLFIPALIFTLLSNQLSLLGPMYSGKAIDAIELASGVDFDAVWENVIMMVGCYLLSAILSYCLAVIMIHLSQRIVYKMRKQVFEKLNTLPVSYFDTHPTGDIISRISYDIDTINASLSHDLVQVMTSVYTVVGSLIFMWRISRPLILIFVITVPASVLFTRYRSKKVRPMFSKRSRKLGELNGYAEEMLSGTRTIEAYGKQDEISRRFNIRNEETMEAYYQAEYYGSALGPSVNFINNLSMSLVAMFGGLLYMLSQNGRVLEGTVFFITLGGVAQFVQYSRKFAGPINEFANILHEFQSAFSAAERVFRILDEEPEAPDTEIVRKGNKPPKILKEEHFTAMREHGVPEWYIESCLKIKYMFPKAHAAAYIISALRLGWYKVYYPLEFYAAFFTVAPGGFDGVAALKGKAALKEIISEIENKADKSQKEDEQYSACQLALEAVCRGIKFLPVSLEHSDSHAFLPENGKIRLPFSCLPGLGDTAAVKIAEACKGTKIFSVEELSQKAKISKAVIEILQQNGVLDGLSETNQISMFSFMD